MIFLFTIWLVQALIALTESQPQLLKGNFVNSVNDLSRLFPARSTIMNLTDACNSPRRFNCLKCHQSRTYRAHGGSRHYKMQFVELAL